jgi:hypothetical protein
MHLPQPLRKLSDSLVRWDDAVAVSKAFEQLRVRLIGRLGIYEVITVPTPLEGPPRGRQLPVIVKTRTKVTGAAEHFVRHTTLLVNSRFGVDITSTIRFEPLPDFLFSRP